MSHKPNRFDFVAYDLLAVEQSNFYKNQVSQLAESIETLGSARARALALTKLEECYMWIGKAIRDDQIARNGEAPLQEQRVNL